MPTIKTTGPDEHRGNYRLKVIASGVSHYREAVAVEDVVSYADGLELGLTDYTDYHAPSLKVQYFNLGVAPKGGHVNRLQIEDYARGVKFYITVTGGDFDSEVLKVRMREALVQKEAKLREHGIELEIIT